MAPPHQVAPPEYIRSIELFRRTPGSVPVITLNSGQTLQLRFDELAETINTFQVQVKHYNADWTESTLLPSFVHAGFRDDIIAEGTPGVGQYPSYFSYSYTFPNPNLDIQISGNFMLQVYEYGSRELLFTLPFFVMEDRGRLNASVTGYFEGRTFPNHQVFTDYHYPPFVSMPIIDIDMYVTQNQFWGRSQIATQRDVSSPDLIRMHIDRNEGFAGRYEFRPLVIDDIRSISRGVIDVFPDRDPPLIRLQYDVVDLDINPRPSRSYAYGAPATSRAARYTEVEFNLERPSHISPDEEIYVLGSFTNWNLSELQRMNYDSEQDAFRATIMIKEGRYDYTYSTITNNRLSELSLAAFFAQTIQDYQIMIYYHDQQEQYDRLLQFGSVRSR